MNAKFKPLGLVAAVAAATAGYSGVSAAQTTVSGDGLGDVGLIPYYSVRDGFVTGVHVTNTSDRTQVVKIRMRRGVDSMDALDFNVIMSPKDVWTGFVQDEGDNITFNTTDTSCTAPALQNGKFVMPGIYREGAEEGYIEVIAMGTPVDEEEPIAVAAKHDSEGQPLDCTAVRSGFFANGNPGSSAKGVLDNATSNQEGSSEATTGQNNFEVPGNPLQVSFFLRDGASGLEMGNQAVMLKDFLTEVPAITNQQTGLFSGDLLGFDYPDLNGGVPGTGNSGKFVELRNAIGNASVINDWSANADLNVGTDWVITFPGQYTMLNLPHYFAMLATAGTDDAIPCRRGDAEGVQAPGDVAVTQGCDHRDIPAIASFDVYDREEQQRALPEGDLVVSPQLPGEVVRTQLPYEVNVVQWGAEPVLGSVNSDIVVQVPESPFGWAELSVSSNTEGDLAVCEATSGNTGLRISDPEQVIAAVGAYSCSTEGVERNQIPKIGFVAWERSFPSNPSANYGRAIEHAYGSGF